VEPLKTITARCEFASEDVLRRCFVRQTSVTPREYRQLSRRTAR
jgi:transcriptional regulator GlxA family with amidase domain